MSRAINTQKNEGENHYPSKHLFNCFREESDVQASRRDVNTYSGSSASLSDPRLIQIMRGLVEVLGGFFRALFVLLEVGDGDVGFLSCIE